MKKTFFLFVFNILCLGNLLHAQCPVEKKLTSQKWILYMSDMIGIFEFATGNQLNVYVWVGDSLQLDNSKKWRITTNCQYLILNQETDSLIMDFSREGILLLEKKGQADEFGRFRPEEKIFLRAIPLHTTALTGYLQRLEMDYPEIYYSHSIRAEQSKNRRAYTQHFQTSQDSVNALQSAKDSTATAAVERQAAEAAAAAAMSDTLTATDVIETPTNEYVFTDEMKQFTLTSGGGEPFWNLTVKDGFATFNAGDLPEYEFLKLPMVRLMTQKNGKIEVKTLQFKDYETGIDILLTLSDDKKNKCSDGMSDKNYKYTVKVAISDKKYEGCGTD